MADRYVITAVGDDRPGIVAAFTGALLPLDVNLEDTAMTLLEGQFAMVLVVTLPQGGRHAMGDALAEVADELGLTVDVRPVATPHGAPHGTECSLTVHGADRPGIVHRITRTLADLGVNIVDLATRVLGRDTSSPVYAMLLDLRLPQGVTESQVREALEPVAEALGVDCSLRVVDVDVF